MRKIKVNSLKTVRKLKPQKFGVHIKCSNLDASIRFYKAFGFKEVFAFGPRDFLRTLDPDIDTAPESYRGVVFAIGDTHFEIADAHIAVKPEVFKERIESSKVSAMVDMQSLDEVEAVCKKEGYKIAVPRKKYPWGMTELVIKDPDGFVLVFRMPTT